MARIALGVFLFLIVLPFFGFAMLHYTKGFPLAHALEGAYQDFEVALTCPAKPLNWWDFANRREFHYTVIPITEDGWDDPFRTVCARTLGGVPVVASYEPNAAKRQEAEDFTVGQLRSAERAIQDAVNQYRGRSGSPKLTYSREIAETARIYAQRMLSEGFFGHVDPRGQGIGDRFAEAGLTCGENIAQAPRSTSVSSFSGGVVSRQNDILTMTPEALGEYLVEQWVENPSLQETMRERRFALGGVGLAYSPEEGLLYIVHDMCE